MDNCASRDDLVGLFRGVHPEVRHEEAPHALHKGLILRRTLGMPLHTDVTRKGLRVKVSDSFHKAVRRFGPRFELRSESIDALMVV